MGRAPEINELILHSRGGVAMGLGRHCPAQLLP